MSKSIKIFFVLALSLFSSSLFASYVDFQVVAGGGKTASQNALAACNAAYPGSSNCGSNSNTTFYRYSTYTSTAYSPPRDGQFGDHDCHNNQYHTQNCVVYRYYISASCPSGTIPDSNGICVLPEPEPEPDFTCPDGTKVFAYLECDVKVSPELDKFKCYDGTEVSFSFFCPEYIPQDPENPTEDDPTQPNGVCESGNYSFASVDPDCRAPKPTPCPGECLPDSTDPAGDHNGDGIPNELDPNADSDGDGIPNGVDPTPNGPDGTSGSGSNGGYHGDSDGDGIPDQKESDDDQGDTSGGDSCSTPPVCTQDAIQCAILRDTWKNRCNTDYEVGDIEDCSRPDYTCKGDPIACASLKIKRNEFCIGKNLDELNAEILLDQAMDDLVNSVGNPTTTENGVLSSLFGEDEDISNMLTDALSAPKPYSSTCPPPRTISFSFGDAEFNYEILCDAAEQLAILVRLLTALLCGFIFYRVVLSSPIF